jgi:hypothetical protein
MQPSRSSVSNRERTRQPGRNWVASTWGASTSWRRSNSGVGRLDGGRRTWVRLARLRQRGAAGDGDVSGCTDFTTAMA